MSVPRGMVLCTTPNHVPQHVGEIEEVDIVKSFMLCILAAEDVDAVANGYALGTSL